MPIDSQSDKLKSSPVFGDSALLKVSALKANDSRRTNANKILVNRFIFAPPIVYLSKVFSVPKIHFKLYRPNVKYTIKLL